MADEIKVNDRRWWVRGESAPADAEPPRLKPTYVEELEARLAAKDAELQQLLARYRAATDEFEQARARLRRELQKDVERGRRALIGSFLEVLDNLDRALDAGRERLDDPFVQGVALVRQQFLSTLEGLGVTRIDPLGQPFDPTFHEAVSTVPPADGLGEGYVAGVVKPGYLIEGELLRPAIVAVVGAAAGSTSSTG
ncbi:MAG: nucleotide exchange factor GrpE [Acidobacteriota bacterium]|jgi:molecular chaperone GrpE